MIHSSLVKELVSYFYKAISSRRLVNIRITLQIYRLQGVTRRSVKHLVNRIYKGLYASLLVDALL